MMKSRRLAPPPSWRRRPPPADLFNDTITEILLRLPPDDPASLVHASLVCKLWHHVLSEPTFPDRYREFHGTPPLLGFLSASYTSGYDQSTGRFVPTATTQIPFRQPVFGCRALDCRHGRVLLDMVDDTTRMVKKRLAVWDPVTGDHKELSDPRHPAAQDLFGRSGAVLCAAAASGCDHCSCQNGPFKVVFVRTSFSYNQGNSNNAARAWVYSSETGSWSTPATVQIRGYAEVERTRAAIVGDQRLYWLLSPGAGILEYDLGERCLTVIDSPSTYTYDQPGILMAMEEGRCLGFVGVKDDYSALHLWTTKANPNGSLGWVQDRVISLNNLVPIVRTAADTHYHQLIEVVGFAEGVDILLLGVGEYGTWFTFELKSGQFRKLSKPVYSYYDDYFPYLSFYIPGK